MEQFVGVLGGMGPDATVLFLDRVAKLTDAGRDQDHVNLMCAQHCTIPDRTAYILDHAQPNPLPPMLDDVTTLATIGAQLIAIPCNTAHYFYDELQAATDVPILNMIELTADALFARFPDARRVGVLGTRGTVGSGLYQRAIQERGGQAVNPTERVQREVDGIIFDEVKGGRPIDEDRYRAVLAAMVEAGCDVMVVGCTELSVPEFLVPHDFPTVDALEELARATILGAGKRLRSNTPLRETP